MRCHRMIQELQEPFISHRSLHFPWVPSFPMQQLRAQAIIVSQGSLLVARFEPCDTLFYNYLTATLIGPLAGHLLPPLAQSLDAVNMIGIFSFIHTESVYSPHQGYLYVLRSTPDPTRRKVQCCIRCVTVNKIK